MNALQGSPRIALFTHDTFGLGHIQRSHHLIQALSERFSEAPILLISGSPVLHLLKHLPPNADYVKIPTVVKTGDPASQPSHLPLSVSEIICLRAQIIHQTMRRFDPDVLIVDNFPLGSNGELLPTLKEAKRSGTKIILGLRDVIDSSHAVRAEWKKQRIYDVLDRYYDLILVYGIQQIFDVIDAYAIPDQIARKVRYCGYLTSTAPAANEDPEDVRRELGIQGRMILVTGGGGGDAFPLLSTFLEALPKLAEISALLVLGPMMGPMDREKIRNLANDFSNVVLRNSVPDMARYMTASDLVVSMCGYNLAAEIALYRPKAVIVPRTWRYGQHAQNAQSTDEREQIIRARAFARMGLARLIEPKDLTAEHLAEKISEALQQEPPLQQELNVRGLETAANYIQEIISG